jgi:hypothetical protein
MMPAKIIHRIRPSYPRHLTQDHLRMLRVAFISHRSCAHYRGIGFEMSFSQWLDTWIASGKLDQRGSKRGQYCMSRFHDRGPYALGNVEIILPDENAARGHRGKIVSDETRRRISLAKMGKSKSAEHRHKLSLALKGRTLSAEQLARRMAARRAAEIVQHLFGQEARL